MRYVLFILLSYGLFKLIKSNIHLSWFQCLYATNETFLLSHWHCYWLLPVQGGLLDLVDCSGWSSSPYRLLRTSFRFESKSSKAKSYFRLSVSKEPGKIIYFRNVTTLLYFCSKQALKQFFWLVDTLSNSNYICVIFYEDITTKNFI